MMPEKDNALWRRFTETIAPLKKNRAPRIAPPAARSGEDHRGAVPDHIDAGGSAHSLPLNGDRRVRRGKVAPEARLDLHGMSAVQARTALMSFLADSAGSGLRCVLVITGKGTGEGALRALLPEWLSDGACRALLSSHAPAHRSHGGAGAWYVFLRASP